MRFSIFSSSDSMTRHGVNLVLSISACELAPGAPRLQGARPLGDRGMSLVVKVFGCRPHGGGAAHSGPASANLQWRKPREGIRQAVQRELSIIGCRTYFRFRSRAIFEEPRPRMRAQLWRYGTSIAKWGK